MSSILKFSAALVVIASMSALAAPPPRFPAGSVWHENVANAPLHPNSTSMLNKLDSMGGWGNGKFQIDFSLHVFHDAPSDAPLHSVIPHRSTGEYWTPDCEALPSKMPVPTNAAFEGSNNLTCDSNNSDCHLLVQQGNLLYELYSGNMRDGTLEARCLAVWNLSAVYPPEGRGDHCTSADAAGFPIAPLLVNADEVAAKVGVADSDLGHAIRFILPNARMATDSSLGGRGGRLYVRPASHAGGPSGPADSVPYGVRMRLKSNFNMSGYSAAAKVILRTMQRYGIVLADGGNIALTFESDKFTTAKWSSLGIGPHLFWNGSEANGTTPVKVVHFEIIDTGPRIGETWNCVRSTVWVGDPVFLDGFEPPA